MPESLAVLLRESTQEAHEAAENASFMSSLMGGHLSAEAYADLLDQYWFFYRALEQKADAFEGDPQIGEIVDRRLDRLPAIETDVLALRGRPAHETEPLPATVEYVARIEGIGADEPERFLAHHYLRYLGDLSGGQVVGRLVGRHYGIADDALTMYRFAGIEKPKPYKDRYRDLLAGLDFSPAQRERLIEEARAGFQLNKRIFDQLGERYLPAAAAV
ncbi:biliverdin-producing heme oxygenase [Sediminivirga luteola]|uniref:Heme oxygenase n=1 Tax=Sediminivirga luteola TaxID=1774748 RepID=A0A8J2U131_9MICO|nr:biliverdin-producing heme oxygenase [Sediminivirga luteola]GGA26805.1 heme oxygenase [Sediminivirga luteola]